MIESGQVGPVHQDRKVRKDFDGGRSCCACHNLFPGPPRIQPNGKPPGFRRLRNGGSRFRLHQGISAGQGDTVQITGALQVPNDVAEVLLAAAPAIMGIRVLTTRTMMGTALEKQSITDTGSIHTGMPFDTGNPNLSCCHGDTPFPAISAPFSNFPGKGNDTFYDTIFCVNVNRSLLYIVFMGKRYKHKEKGWSRKTGSSILEWKRPCPSFSDRHVPKMNKDLCRGPHDKRPASTHGNGKKRVLMDILKVTVPAGCSWQPGAISPHAVSGGPAARRPPKILPQGKQNTWASSGRRQRRRSHHGEPEWSNRNTCSGHRPRQHRWHRTE
jgi:hypothetical protein